MQLKESYTLLDQLMASQTQPLTLAAQRQHMRVAAPAAKLESHEHMTMLVYVFNSLWVAGELGIIKPTGNLLPFCKLLLQQAQANLKAGAPVRCRHLAAAKSAIIQYGWMLQEMSQADYVKVHRETDKRTVTSVRKLKPRRRS